MKKKYGLVVLGVAAGFWACGSGDIIKPDQYDELMASQDEDDSAAIGGVIDILSPVKCPECFAGLEFSSSSVAPPPPPLSSSSVYHPPQEQSSSSARRVRSSSSVQSSSSYSPYYPRSSSHGGFRRSSSSSATTPGDGVVGTCAPNKAIVEKDEDVVWKFTRDPAVDPQSLMSATFTWSMPDASRPTATATGANGISQKVQYATSGVHEATVVVSMGAASYTVQCTPVQQNGEVIKNCKCSTAATSVDYTATPDISWTVGGCTSAAGPNFSYVWDGTPGGATYTKTFVAATASYAPTLKVANTDNTVIEVTCPAVKVTKGPEYTFTAKDKPIALPAGESNVVFDLPASWHGGTTTGTCTLRCGEADGPVTITVGRNSSKPDNSATLSLPVSQTINKTSLVIKLDKAAKCQVGY